MAKLVNAINGLLLSAFHFTSLCISHSINSKTVSVSVPGSVLEYVTRFFFVHQDHLTEALADLDAALDKELNQQNDDLYEELDREGSAGELEEDEEGTDEENKENVEIKRQAMEAEELEGKEGDNSKVEQLEEQCRTLVNELDTVKGKFSLRVVSQVNLTLCRQLK